MLDLADFKEAIIYEFKELKKAMYKELNKIMVTMIQWIQNLNRQTFKKKSNGNSGIEKYNN